MVHESPRSRYLIFLKIIFFYKKYTYSWLFLVSLKTLVLILHKFGRFSSRYRSYQVLTYNINPQHVYWLQKPLITLVSFHYLCVFIIHVLGLMRTMHLYFKFIKAQDDLKLAVILLPLPSKQNTRHLWYPQMQTAQIHTKKGTHYTRPQELRLNSREEEEKKKRENYQPNCEWIINLNWLRHIWMSLSESS